MYQQRDGSRGGACDGNPYAFSNASSWNRFGYENPSSPLIDIPQPMQEPERVTSSSAMDWTPDLGTDLDQNDDGGAMPSTGAIKLEDLNMESQGGVGRLVAHFENKGYVPPLPPRPMNNQTNASNAVSPISSHFGSLNSLAQTNRVASPITDLGSPPYGSLGAHSPVTSPMSTSRSPMSYNILQNAQRIHSPVVDSSCSPFGSLDEFMSAGHVNNPMTSQTMSPSQAIMTSSQHMSMVPGTPGFQIWRPPASATPKPEPNLMTRPNDFGGYYRPPVPTTPKPVMGASNQFILDFNPAMEAKAKPPAKPPRPRPSPRKPIVAQMLTPGGMATPTPVNTTTPVPRFTPVTTTIRPALLAPQPSETLSSPVLVSSTVQRQEASSLRAQGARRSSREQVPAEAWEQYKATIRSLYLEERKPLKEVMSIMAEKYGFQATPKMYKTRFSQWGFVKNNTEEEVKRLLSMKFQRDAEGKVSEFVRNGRVVNLGTYLKRKGVTEYDLVDFELPADLPAHIRCRTPTPPPALKSPDLLRAQELVIGNMRKVFLHCRQFETETDTHVEWPSIMHWGAWASEPLLEANFYFEAGDVDQGGNCLMRAFKQVEMDLKKISLQGIMELILGMINRDPGMMTALCKYLAAYSMTNLDRLHPLRQIFGCLYEVQQKHGAKMLSELLWGCISVIAEELEAIYGCSHPYIARTWADLALFYNQVNVDRLEKLALELGGLLRQLERQLGATSADVVVLRYVTLQLMYCAAPHSEATKQACMDLWNLLRRMGVLFPMVLGTRSETYCYHSVVKLDPFTKRCRRRYDFAVSVMSEIVGCRIQPYFEEDFHTSQHAQEPQESWALALEQAGPRPYLGLI